MHPFGLVPESMTPAHVNLSAVAAFAHSAPLPTENEPAGHWFVLTVPSKKPATANGISVQWMDGWMDGWADEW